MLQVLKHFFNDEEAASAVEYGLIIGLIAVALVVVLGMLSGGLGNLFSEACEAITGAACTAES